MGIYSDIQQDVGEAFNTDLSDAVYPLTLKRVTYGSYDPDIGKPVEIVTETSTRGVAQPVNSSHYDGEVVKIGDVEFTILHSELSETPTLDHTIVYNDLSYIINSVLSDPASATWVLLGRTT